MILFVRTNVNVIQCADPVRYYLFQVFRAFRGVSQRYLHRILTQVRDAALTRGFMPWDEVSKRVMFMKRRKYLQAKFVQITGVSDWAEARVTYPDYTTTPVMDSYNNSGETLLFHNRTISEKYIHLKTFSFTADVLNLGNLCTIATVRGIIKYSLPMLPRCLTPYD